MPASRNSSIASKWISVGLRAPRVAISMINLSCRIRLGIQAKGMTDSRVSRRHAVDNLGIEPPMLK